MAGQSTLQGRCVLVVENEPLIAWDLAEALREQGAEIVGPFACVEDALHLLATEGGVDVALLDVNLGNDQSVFAVARELRSRGIPFVFCTGYRASDVDEQFRGASCCEKPVDSATLTSILTAAVGALGNT